jgi:hypothetical protein
MPACEIIVVSLAVVGSAAAQAPTWMVEDPPGFPASRYLLGRGEGSTLPAAQDAARAEIAKVFEVRVRQQMTAVESLVRAASQQAVGVHEALSVYQVTRSDTDVAVEGIEIVAQEQVGGRFYALGGLDRAAAARRLEGELQQIDSEMNRQADRAAQAASRVETYQGLRVLFGLAQRYALLEQLLALLRDGQGRSTQHTPEAVEGRLLAVLRALTVGVEVDVSGELAPINAAMTDAIHRTGLATAGQPAAADIVVRGRASLGDVSTDTFGFVHARCLMELEAEDQRRGVSIGTLRLEANEARNDQPSAVQACVRQLVRLLVEGDAGQQSLRDALNTWINPPLP